MRRHLLAATAALFLSMNVWAQTALDEGFRNPPKEARARTWWHWVNGNVTRRGITADLEAMAANGVQEAQLFNIDGGLLNGPATYMSEEWLQLVHHAAQEANRLGLELCLHNCAGWSATGGPWVTPEYSMQMLVWTETLCTGGKEKEPAIRLPQPKTNMNFYRDIAVLAFPKPKSDERIPELDTKNIGGTIRNRLDPSDASVSAEAIVKRSEIIDLTDRMQPDGSLNWNAPEGEWVILRMGHTSTGTHNHPAAQGGRGLEVDKMNRKAVDLHWQEGIMPVLDRLGSLVGTTLNNLLVDSYEVGCANYTPGFDRLFTCLRGYNYRDFLPVMAGYYVESGEVSERFLWDVRRMVSELMTRNYYDRFRELCHKHGMKFSTEPYWGPFNSMDVGLTADVVMCEFWSGKLFFDDSPRLAASAAHLRGTRFVGAEAFTGNLNWLEHPATIKTLGDKAWVSGVNRLIFHSFAHQPWDVAPGVPMGGNGLEFNRHNTWWKPGKAFLDYIGRSQFLLQRGLSVADVLVFVGESSPNDGFTMPEINRMGFNYDLVGPQMMQQLTARDGMIHSPGGTTHRVLVLHRTEWMTPELLSKIEEFARNGVTIIGRRPTKSPSLSGYPQCDAQVSQMAEQLWGSGLVKDCGVEEILHSDAFVPDFRTERDLGNDIGFVHRRDGDTDIYLVDNARLSPLKEHCRFRVSGKRPELWNAETGEIRDLPEWMAHEDGTISIPLQFESDEALFVIFRHAADAGAPIAHSHTQMEQTQVQALPNLNIIRAEYGTFLPAGLVDVTRELNGRIRDGKLDVNANFHDAAPGYIKELRIAYEVDGKYHEGFLAENEWLPLKAQTPDGLKILSAVYGKFDKGLQGIPPRYAAEDVTEKVKAMVAAGRLTIPVTDSLASAPFDAAATALRITYSVNEENLTQIAYRGETLFLGKARPEPRLLAKDSKYIWKTPTPGTLHYTTSSGKTRHTRVKQVPAPLDLSGEWEVTFKDDTRAVFDSLISWPHSADERIRYFSGTASYKKTFTVPKKWLNEDYSLELDLGDVRIMAEVILNGQPLGVLWKAPFRVDVSQAIRSDENELEIRVTNLWPNALIGDERYPLEPEWRDGNLQTWPGWLENPAQRNSARTTFTPRRVWGKDSPLLPSGLLGPVQLRPYRCVKIKAD